MPLFTSGPMMLARGEKFVFFPLTLPVSFFGHRIFGPRRVVPPSSLLGLPISLGGPPPILGSPLMLRSFSEFWVFFPFSDGGDGLD